MFRPWPPPETGTRGDERISAVLSTTRQGVSTPSSAAVEARRYIDEQTTDVCVCVCVLYCIVRVLEYVVPNIHMHSLIHDTRAAIPTPPLGTLVYSTCTLAPDENEGQIAYALATYKDQLQLRPAEPRVGAQGRVGCGLDERECGMVQRFEPSDGHEGFFIAKFVKVEAGGGGPDPTDLFGGVSDDESSDEEASLDTEENTASLAGGGAAGGFLGQVEAAGVAKPPTATDGKLPSGDPPSNTAGNDEDDGS